MTRHRNNQTIYNTAAKRWWTDDLRWVRTLKTWCQRGSATSISSLLGKVQKLWTLAAPVGSWPKLWPAAVQASPG